MKESLSVVSFSTPLQLAMMVNPRTTTKSLAPSSISHTSPLRDLSPRWTTMWSLQDPNQNIPSVRCFNLVIVWRRPMQEIEINLLQSCLIQKSEHALDHHTT